MDKQVGVGSVVFHKTKTGVPLVIITDKPPEHGVKWYECRWYNEKTGRFEVPRLGIIVRVKRKLTTEIYLNLSPEDAIGEFLSNWEIRM